MIKFDVKIEWINNGTETSINTPENQECSPEEAQHYNNLINLILAFCKQGDNWSHIRQDFKSIK